MTSALPVRLHHGRFELLREVGRGATGTVFEARDSLHQRIIALKRLDHVDPQSLYLLKSEFRSAAEITHENLVRLGELFADGGSVFFTMELVSGVDFLSYVRPRARGSSDPTTLVRPRGAPEPVATPPPPPPRERPRFDEAALRAALRGLFTGLHALHALGLVHRDVKPTNALVEPSGRVVLLDFGLAAGAGAREEAEQGWIVGTPRYMAPEQVRGEAVGPAADTYAAGVMLHEALTGRPPIDGSAREIMFGKQLLRVSGLASRFPELPEDLAALCEELLRLHPAERPSDEEVLRRLGARAPVVAPATSEVFVGRGRELAALSRALDDSRRRPVVAVVRGESGVGKTALVQRFTAELRRSHPRARVLRGRCYERENIPFNAIDAVVDALSIWLVAEGERELGAGLGDPRDIAALARVFPVLRRSRAVEWAAMDDPLGEASPQELRLRAFRALARLLAARASEAPVVLAIDDLQWADKDSLALLDELTAGGSAPPLLVVATMRPEGTLGPLAQGERDLRVMDLGGLDEREAAALVERLSSSLPEADVRALVREARGHPLYLIALLGLHRRGDARPSLDESLRLRALSLPERWRAILERIVVAGVPVRQGIVAEAAGVSIPECLEAIDALRRASFVRTAGTSADDAVEPFHDRVREALAGALDAEAARRVHRELAAALEHGMREPRERAALVHHLEHAGERARAARHAEDAAAELAHALAFDQAAEMYRRAIRLGRHEPEERARLVLACGRALRDAGRGAEAAERFVEAARMQRTEDERLLLEVAAAEQWVACGHLERGLGLLEDVLERLGARWPRTQPEALAAFALERAALTAERLAPRRRGRVDASERLRLELFQSIASGLGSVDPLRAWIFQTRALRRILRTGERDLAAIGFALEALLVGLEGSAGAAQVRRLVARAEELALGSKSARVHAWARLADGGTSYFLGRYAAAPGPLAEAEMRFRDDVRGDSGGLNIARVLKVWTAVFRGDLRQLAVWIPEYERDARRRDDRYAQVSLNLAGHVGWLVDGDLERARAKIAERAWRPPGGAYHIQSWYELLAECEQALYAAAGGAPLDEPTRARLERGFRALGTSLVFLRAEVIRVYGTWLRARYLLACAAQAQGIARRRSLSRARSLAERLGRERAPVAHAYAAAVRAGCHALAGRREDALVELRVALELAEHASLFGIAAIAKRRIGEIGGRAAERGEAERWFRAQGVADPARLSGMYLPGFA